MNNPENLATFGTHDTGERQRKQTNKQKTHTPLQKNLNKMGNTDPTKK